EYSWAVVWLKDDGDLHVEFVGEATFGQAQQVAAGTLSLEQAVGPQAWADHSGVAEIDAETAGQSDSESDSEPATEPTQTVDEASAGETEDAGDEIFDDLPDGDEEEPAADEDEPVFDDVVG